MGSVGPFQLLIIALVILILFGRGRISEMMGDFGKGIKSFKQSMNDGDGASAAPALADSPLAETGEATAAPDNSRIS